MTTCSSQNCGCDGLPSLLPHHAGWIDVVDVWARSPHLLSGALCGLDSEKAEVLSTSPTIPGVGSEWSFWFSPIIQIARCQTTHLAPLIFSELGQKITFPDSRMTPDLLRGTGKSIGGDLDVDDEGSKQRRFEPVQSLHHGSVGYQPVHTRIGLTKKAMSLQVNREHKQEQERTILNCR
jgi:hypothetical protein